MARRAVLGGFRATCVLASAVSQVATRSLTKVLDSFNPENASARSARGVWQRSMEALEPRQLMAGITLGSDGVLNIIAPYTQGNTIDVTVSGTSIVGKYNATTKTVAASSVKSIKITGGQYADTIRINSAITKPSYVVGGAGNDKIYGGSGPDKILGSSDNDSILGNAGNDTIYGETGNDTLDGGSGTDVVSGGTGTNLITDGGGTAAPAPTQPAPTTSTVAVTALDIWDVVYNKKVASVTSGATIDLAKLPAKITLIAQGTAASMKFGYDANGSYRVENLKPWSISGDIDGKPVAFNLATGSHTVKVTPYTKTSAGGTAGATKTWTLNVIRSTTSQPAPTQPAPSEPEPTPSAPAPSTSTGTIAVRVSSAAAPQAVITNVTSASIHAGQSFAAHAMNSKLNYGTALTARYVWDFGDSGSKYNVMEGFNAAHYYANPGTYTAKLTVTNEAGKGHTASVTVNVAAAGRKRIYVSTAGNDANDGLTEAKPIKSWDKARTKFGDNVEMLFKGGETFEAKSAINVYGKNVVIGSYGTGKAILKYTGPVDYGKILWIAASNGEQTVKNLIFDSIYLGVTKDGLPQGIGVGGVGSTIIGNEFRNLGYAINAYGGPRGLLAQDNTAPIKTGLRGYFAWLSGQDHVFQGNYVSNVDGHVIRMALMDRVNISNNDFTNPNETSGYRGTLTIHSGSYAYVRNNKLTDGWFSVGPLGNADGLAEKESRFNWSVFENNTVNRSRFMVLHGANNTMFRNNVIKVNDNDWGIEVEGYNSTYGRGVNGVAILNNTVINYGTTGNFLHVAGRAAGISLANNLYLAPKLITGQGGAAPVVVYDTSLASFTKISNNVWPMPSITQYAQGGINYIWPIWSNAAGYQTPAEWNAQAAVGTDYFEDLTFNSTTFGATGGTNRDAGTVWAGVFTDRNGKIRPTTGGWTVGAIEA